MILPLIMLLTFSYSVSVLERAEVDGVVTTPAAISVVKADTTKFVDVYTAGESANHNGYND
jgi:hypothetical protein